MSQHNRLQWIDNLRGLAIILVVLGHTIQYFAFDFDSNHVANYIYSFHMPLFFMISGFCAGYSSSAIGKTMQKSSCQLLVPYVIWSLILCGAVRYDYKDVVIVNPRYWFLLVLWYIRNLHALCIFIAKRSGIKDWVPAVIIILILGVVQFVVELPIPCFGFIYYYMIYYVMGYHLCRNFTVIKKCLINTTSLVVMTLIFIVWGYFFRRGSVPAAISFVPGFAYFIPLALIGCYVCFSLSLRFLDRNNTILGFNGVHSLGVYLFSGLLCYFIFTWVPFVGKLTMNNHFLVYILFVAISALSGLFILVLSRVNWLRPFIGLQRIQ